HTRFSRDWSSDVCSSDLEMRLSGAGEVEVTLTMEPDGAYRLDFTGPKEIWDKAGTTSVHFNDTCQDPPVILDHEETGSDREETRSEERRVGIERRARRTQ